MLTPKTADNPTNLANAQGGANSPMAAPLQEILGRVFGHDGFRPYQQAVCEHVTEGRDVW